MVITLSPELEAALNKRAKRQGVAPDVLALELLREELVPPAPHGPSKDEWERQLRQIATDCGVSLSDEAIGSEGIYE